MKKTLIARIALNCEWLKSVSPLFEAQVNEQIAECQNELPHGSGIDCGCKINADKSGEKEVEITFDYHNMDEMGGYTHWTKYLLVATPLLTRVKLQICCTEGVDEMDGNYDYFYDCFDCLTEE